MSAKADFVFGQTCRRGAVLLFSLALLSSTTVLAADMDAGLSRYRQGDYKGAMESWRPLADAGNAEAQYSIGYMFHFGQGTGVDHAKAAEWYGKAAGQGHLDAQYALGQVRELGLGGKPDLNGARESYLKAAEAGHADSQYAMARLYTRGRGVPRDPKQAIPWLRKAAEQDQPAALYQLGSAHETGWGVVADPVLALLHYLRAGRADPAKLASYDPAFNATASAEALKKRMTPAQIKQAETLLAEFDKARAAKEQPAEKAKEAPKAPEEKRVEPWLTAPAR